MMSEGMKPYDFVQQVYYLQEKVLLDFTPEDDKYREVLTEANLVLQELQNVEDWTWLRDRLVLGPCHHFPGAIPEWDLPSWVYKPSTLQHDCLRLEGPHISMSVPIASAGNSQYLREIEMSRAGSIHMPDIALRAVVIGNTIALNRPLTPRESRAVAIMDVQRRIPQIHVCDGSCTNKDGTKVFDYTLDQNHDYVKPCTRIEENILTDIPDPNYVVMATAARHAEGSPPALARVAGLQDAAQRILSAMRSNDAAATDPDWQDWDVPGYISVY